ncbi:hypothetical protein J3F83DRAFT_713506 [Trichoderma novae-zelandiae]
MTRLLTAGAVKRDHYNSAVLCAYQFILRNRINGSESRGGSISSNAESNAESNANVESNVESNEVDRDDTGISPSYAAAPGPARITTMPTEFPQATPLHPALPG